MMLNCITIFVFFLSLGQSVLGQQKVTLYDNIYYDGDSVTVSVGQCQNVYNFNDRTSSIKSDGCTRLWEHNDCTGRKVDISSPGSDNLVELNFNDLTTSVSDCSLLPTKVQINMNTTDAPQLAQFGATVKKIMEDWFPFVENLMRTPAYQQVYKIDVYFDPKYDGVAYASGNRIVGAVNYFKDHQDDYGAFIHEMTHVIHQNRACPGWLVEGYAEWTRRWFYEPWTVTEKPTGAKGYLNGYSDAAWLIAYVNSAITGRPLAYLLNKGCQDGSYGDSTWQDLTGKTVDQWWNQMVNDKNYPWRK